MGFVPYDDPQLVIYCVVDEPNVDDEAHSSYAQNIVREILKEVLPYMNIYPDEELTGANENLTISGSDGLVGTVQTGSQTQDDDQSATPDETQGDDQSTTPDEEQGDDQSTTPDEEQDDDQSATPDEEQDDDQSTTSDEEQDENPGDESGDIFESAEEEQ
jgi:stage V sporulation protein D (sporulation-specific penicillin-binding protein)